MSEQTNGRTIYSLSEVALSIHRTLSGRYPGAFWIKAEMNRLNRYAQSGHCYPDLVEKSDGRIVAQMSATIWKDDYQRINELFLRTLLEPLKDGIKILFSARISFHPVYGLNLRITEIDPSWSLGELEKEKRQAMERIRQEGIFHANKLQSLPLLPARIAVISAETSNGYADFRKIMEGNPWGYRFFHMLFPSLLQGDNAVPSILHQLERIGKVKRHFDAVAIIRGGGGDIGLSCYNTYSLAREVALFPLPVITGIGHSTNETVTEMVAYRNAITPTDLADFLVQKFHDFAVQVNRASEKIAGETRRLLLDEHERLKNRVRYCRLGVNGLLANEAAAIRQEMARLELGSSGYFRERITELRSLERNIELLDPANVMKRGYSITLAGDRLLKTVGDVGPGTRLKTIVMDGQVVSTTVSVKKTRKNG